MTDTEINIYQDRNLLTLVPANALAAPVFQAACTYPWVMQGDVLAITLGGRTETFTAEAVVLSAKRRMFGLSESWADPRFLKTVKVSDPVAPPTGKTKAGAKPKGRRKKGEEAAALPVGDEQESA